MLRHSSKHFYYTPIIKLGDEIVLFVAFRHSKFWKVDLKEDSLRQRLQFLPNPSGTVHESAIRSTDPDSGEKKPTAEELPSLPSTVGAYTEAPNIDVISLGSDDLADSLTGMDLPQEQDKSQQLLTVQCSMVILAHSIPGTLAFTRTSLTFTADDSSEDYEKASYLV